MLILEPDFILTVKLCARACPNRAAAACSAGDFAARVVDVDLAFIVIHVLLEPNARSVACEGAPRNAPGRGLPLFNRGFGVSVSATRTITTVRPSRSSSRRLDPSVTHLRSRNLPAPTQWPPPSPRAASSPAQPPCAVSPSPSPPPQPPRWLPAVSPPTRDRLRRSRHRRRSPSSSRPRRRARVPRPPPPPLVPEGPTGRRREPRRGRGARVVPATRRSRRRSSARRCSTWLRFESTPPNRLPFLRVLVLNLAYNMEDIYCSCMAVFCSRAWGGASRPWSRGRGTLACPLPSWAHFQGRRPPLWR
jgi:hypothetical protein